MTAKEDDRLVLTDERYWDCGCIINYIHLKAKTLVCSACKHTADEAPDSRPNEIKMHYKDYEGVQVVECLKCDNHYVEKEKTIAVCPHCGNNDTQQTIYLEEESDIRKAFIKDYWR